MKTLQCSREPPKAIRRMLAWAGRLALLALIHGKAAECQMRPEVTVFAQQPSNNHSLVLRFNARLEQVGRTDITAPWGPGGLGLISQVAIDAPGTRWITADALNKTLLLRIDRDGALLPSAVLGHNPLSVVAGADGRMFATTRIPFLAPGPLYAIASDGSVLWATTQPVFKFVEGSPDVSALTPSGELWIGGQTYLCSGCLQSPLLKRVDTAAAMAVQSFSLPTTWFGSAVGDIGALPDGTIAAMITLGLVHIDRSGILALSAVEGGYNGVTTQLRVDAAGHVWLLEGMDPPQGKFGQLLLGYDPVDGTPVGVLDTGGIVIGFAFDPTGEAVYAVTNSQTVFFQKRLVRINAVTGVRSSVPLDPPYNDSKIGFGDPTGFVYANVTDQAGDNDGDGTANRAETLAGSNPFDPESRPDGPKVYVSFLAGSNALCLRYVDPDGLLDPAKGLDLATLSVTASGYGEILPLLWNFVSAVALEPGGTAATIEFGLLPIPNDAKIRLEATVRDRTGASGFDWQATPPGELD